MLWRVQMQLVVTLVKRKELIKLITVKGNFSYFYLLTLFPKYPCAWIIYTSIDYQIRKIKTMKTKNKFENKTFGRPKVYFLVKNRNLNFNTETTLV